VSLSTTPNRWLKRPALPTPKELAQSIGISLDHLKGLETGQRTLTGTLAGQFASKLGVTVDWLMEYEGATEQWPDGLSVGDKVELVREHLHEIVDGCFNSMPTTAGA
jgi:plasmid maintenance system antidote protein VapI